MDKYSVCLMGAGSIGATKPDDIDYPGSPNILTHANAVTAHTGTELTSIIEPIQQKASFAIHKWNPKSAFTSLEGLNNQPTPDIIIIATPTTTHKKVLEKAISLKPKLIIVEKPFCSNYKEISSINSSVPILVNYTRRFVPEYRMFKQQINKEIFGKCLNARVIYSRGIRRDGCHAIDLMRYFFGECLYRRNLMNDWIFDGEENDPSIPMELFFEGCDNVILQACDGRKYGIFEIDLCFEEGRFRFIDFGLWIEKYPITEKNEWGHKALSYKLTEVMRQQTTLNLGPYHVINNVVKFLDGKEKLLCTLEDAKAVHKIIDQAMVE